MQTIGAYEAKTHLSRLLDDVAHGARITITRHGQPVAMLVPASQAPSWRPDEVIAALHAFRKDKRLGDISIRELIEEGRRY
ncbi:type II toxin-antitoxin system prevent-host-death family antitoxin [soil metagenome]